MLGKVNTTVTTLLMKVKFLSHVWLSATPWTGAHQAPLSMGFSRQGYWSGLPLPSPGDPPNPETDWGQQAKSRMPSRKRCLQGPLAQPAQATGGCCLQRCTLGPHGKESGRLNRLQKQHCFRYFVLLSLLISAPVDFGFFLNYQKS